MKISNEHWTTSRDKWKAIVEAIESKDFRASVKRILMNKPCGYCRAFIFQEPREDDDEECRACPLFQKKLCINDPNASQKELPYWRVSYLDWEDSHDEVLSAAKKILAAIMEDAS